MRFRRISFLLLIALTLVPNNASAYSTGTHAFLTKEMVEFYNLHFSDRQIPGELAQQMIEGSVREDDLTRWMNHFYDPVHNTGLTLKGPWVSAKAWARNSDKQVSALYNPVMNSTLVSLLTVTDPMALRESDYTWERAISDYVKGDKERAFRALGQVIHLIEDMSVPDHTRDDPHPALDDHDALETGSPYELWTKKFNLENPDPALTSRLTGKRPVILGSLDAYFDELATYSNKNFYSKDTIGIGKYSSPEPDYFGIGVDKKFYGFKIDKEFGDYHLVRAKGLLEWTFNKNDLMRSEYLLQDYWNRLSVKAVQHGAGVINLFFEEVEKAQNDPNFIVEDPIPLATRIKDATRSMFANLVGIFTRERASRTDPPSREATEGQGPPSLAGQAPEAPSFADASSEVLTEEEATEGETEGQDPPSEEAMEGEEEDLPSEVLTEEEVTEDEAEEAPIIVVSQGGTSTYALNAGNPKSSEQNSDLATNVVISEVRVADTDAGDEFIELYNPTDEVVDLSGWSIQYVSGTATSTTNVAKKNFEEGNIISAKGFFLIARGLNGSDADGYTGDTAPDMTHRAFALSGASAGAKIFLVSGQDKIASFDDEAIVDMLDYSFLVPESGKSIERNAYSNGCVSAQGEGEFLGNGCDSNDDGNNFAVRETPNPQNTQSLPEPRSAPAQVANFTVAFDLPTFRASLSWGESTDYSGATSTLTYAISYATSSSPLYTDLAEVSATTTYQDTIEEVGVEYSIAIRAKDKDGLASDPVYAEAEVPSPISSLYFFKDTRTEESEKYLLELYYDAYPFAPDIYDKGDAWKILVFYLNKDAKDEFELDLPGEWNPEGTDGVLAVAYERCAGSTAPRYSLILPDTEDRCGTGGGAMNYALKWELLEDLHILTELALGTDDVAYSENDFVTVGMYSPYQSGGENQQFRLAGLDRTKYYFKNTTPEHNAPSAPGGLEFKLSDDHTTLRIVWDKSEDEDTIDDALTYEINYGVGELSEDGWMATPSAVFAPGEASEIGSKKVTKISVEPDNEYAIALRAKDDFGNLSSSTVTTYEVPDISLPYGIADFQWGNLGGEDPEISFSANPYPFMTEGTTGAMLFFLNQLPPANHSFSNTTARWDIGGAHTVLQLRYATCTNANDTLPAGLLLHNESSCPSGGSGLRKNNVLKEVGVGDTQFSVGITTVREDGVSAEYTFDSDDYLTIGFYERQGNTFTNVFNYGKKIYYQE